jgi:hypothetical protein
MKKIFVALITLGLLLVPIFAVHAQSTVRISLDIAPDPVYVNADDYIVLYHGWGACTRGLVQAYLSAVYTGLSIDDGALYIADGRDQYWGSITKMPDGYWVSTCIAGNQKTSSAVYWEYPLGNLTPGEEYEVYYYQWLDHRIIDGADYNGDGRLDSWEGLISQRTFTIIVSE